MEFNKYNNTEKNGNRIRYTVEKVLSSSFYQMPKFLFEEECANLSNDARVLYTLLKDRHELSVKNGWYNKKKEVYLIMKREEMEGILKLSSFTVRKVINELKNLGLIEEDRQGLNKPNLIYLLEYKKITFREMKKSHSEKSANNFHESSNSDSSECENSTSLHYEQNQSEPNQSFSDTNLYQSGSIPQNNAETDFPESNDTIDIDIISHAIENNIPLESLKEKYSKIDPAVKVYFELLIETYKRKPYYNLLKINIDALDVHSIKQIVAGNIDLEQLNIEYPSYQKQIKELFELIVETLSSKKKSFRIAKEDLKPQTVKDAFCVLNCDLMRYVIESLRKNTTEVKNAKAYLLTTIYNAHKTFNNHSSLEFQADLENNGFFIRQDLKR